MALWLRLYLQLRGVRDRRRFLLTAVTALPAGSRIQLHRGDGTRVVLIVGTTRPNEEQRRTRNSRE
jgi:hypothetical protein